MFSKDSKLEKFKDAETIIGSSIKVKGNFQGQGNIIVEGTLEGSLKTDASIYIGEQAKIVANTESKDAIVNGEVRGNIKAKNYSLTVQVFCNENHPTSHSVERLVNLRVVRGRECFVGLSIL